MKLQAQKKNLMCGVLLLCVVTCFAQSAKPPKYSAPLPNGAVPDQKTAILIAEAVLAPVYGEKVLNERPFTATLKDDTWYVLGTFHHGSGKLIAGGVAIVEISKKDGCILRISHSE